MDRRRFVQLASLAGLGFVAPFGATASRADSTKYEGPYWLLVNASGGWDPTFFCDPKGGKIDDIYSAGQIEKAGNIPFAPVKGYGNNGMEVFYTCETFFQKFHQRLTVINGVDTETNNHDVGTRTTWSGDQTDGFPCFASLAAAVAMEKLQIPLAFLSNGGYDTTGGTCSLSRVDADAVSRLAYPNLINPTDQNPGSYNTPTTSARIAAAQAGRLQLMRDTQTLPVLKSSMSELFLARGGDSGLGALAKELSATSLVSVDDEPDLAKLTDQNAVRDAVGLMQQAQIAMLAFKAGVAVSANLNIGGFDTHSNHDVDQSSQVLQLLRGLEYIFTQLDQQGLTSKVYVVVGSDFGRTPMYNAGKGKDHWNITSMMMAGPKVQGNRVIGATDAGFVAKNVDSSLKVGAGGARITTGDIHIALRKLAGVTGTTNDQLFPVIGSELPFFG
jgi:Protein of unknown function (DUF1501)